MKNILILSFLYEDALCLKEFELLKEHYNKIIHYWCFPMKYYGVRATTDGETRIDEENKIIWLHTDDIEKYDKELTNKVYDCFKFIENSNIEYDAIIKTNTSFIINLQQANYFTQQCDTENGILTGISYEYETGSSIGMFMVYRGNFAVFGKNIVQNIVTGFNISEIPLPIQLLYDDIYFSYYLKDKADIFAFGQLAITHQYDIAPYDTIQNIDSFFETMGVCIKIYEKDTPHHDKHKNDTEFDLNHRCADISVMRLFINYIESILIHKRNETLISRFVIC